MGDLSRPLSLIGFHLGTHASRMSGFKADNARLSNGTLHSNPMTLWHTSSSYLSTVCTYDYYIIVQYYFANSIPIQFNPTQFNSIQFSLLQFTPCHSNWIASRPDRPVPRNTCSSRTHPAVNWWWCRNPGKAMLFNKSINIVAGEGIQLNVPSGHRRAVAPSHRPAAERYRKSPPSLAWGLGHYDEAVFPSPSLIW